jgi:CBS domain-containing protein
MSKRQKRKRDQNGEQKYALNPEFLVKLMKIKAEDFTVDKPKKDMPIFICYRSDKVVDVWKGLVKHDFLSCPVILHDESKYYGFVDLVDIVKYIIQHFGDQVLGQERDFWDLVQEEKRFATKVVSDIMTWPLSNRNPYHPVRQGYSALAVLETLARESGLHRVPVIDSKRAIYNLVTQSQVAEFLAQNIDLLGNMKDKPVALCQNFTKEVVSVTEGSDAIDAFNLMVEKNVTGVAVIDALGAMKGALSMRDMKLISYDARLFWRLKQPVKAFIEKLNIEWAERHKRPRQVIFATKQHTIKEVIGMIHEHRVHRVFVVDGEKTMKPIGVASLKDILLEIIT